MLLPRKLPPKAPVRVAPLPLPVRKVPAGVPKRVAPVRKETRAIHDSHRDEVWYNMSAQSKTHEEFVRTLERIVRALRGCKYASFDGVEYVHTRMAYHCLHDNKMKVTLNQVGTKDAQQCDRVVSIEVPHED